MAKILITREVCSLLPKKRVIASIKYSQPENDEKKLKLRSYQKETIDSFLKNTDQIKSGTQQERKLLAVLPTGSGKSVCIANIIKQVREKYDWSILVVTHVNELVEQDMAKLKKWCPDHHQKSEKVDPKKRNVAYHEKILIGTIQTMSRPKRLLQLGQRDLLIIDEAQLVQRGDEGQYGALIKQLKSTNPDLVILGFTATPYRTDSGMLTETWKGYTEVFDKVIHEVKIKWLIENEFLVPLTSPPDVVKLDVENVKINAKTGDYFEKDLEAKVNTDQMNVKIVDQIIEYGKDRQSWLIFACSINHAIRLTAILKKKGINASYLTSNSCKGQRERVITDFKNFTLRALVNVNILTTGFDFPDLDLIAMVRPTMSKVLHGQMIGRVLRPADETAKKDGMLLDFVGNIERNGTLFYVDGSKEEPPQVVEPPPPPPQDIDINQKKEEYLQPNPFFGSPMYTQGEVVLYYIEKYVSKKGNKCLRIEWCLRKENVYSQTYSLFEYYTINARVDWWWYQHGGKKPAPTNNEEPYRRKHEIAAELDKVSHVRWVQKGGFKEVNAKYSHGVSIWEKAKERKPGFYFHKI